MRGTVALRSVRLTVDQGLPGPSHNRRSHFLGHFSPHIASLYPGVGMGTGKFNDGISHAMD